MSSDEIIVMIWMIVTGIIIAVTVGYYVKKRAGADKPREPKRKLTLNEALTNRRIVEVKFLGAGATEYKRGGLGGAMVGGLFAGGLGAVIGGMTPSGKGKQTAKFAIRYDNGDVEIKDVRVGSADYKALMSYVSWDDIGGSNG